MINFSIDQVVGESNAFEVSVILDWSATAWVFVPYILSGWRDFVEDGGPNDSDGVANSVVEDPGKISVMERWLPDGQMDVAVETRGGGGANSGVLLLLVLLRWSVRKSVKNLTDSVINKLCVSAILLDS